MFPDDEPADRDGAGPCIAVTVMSSFENAEMVANLAAGYNAQPRDINGTCVTVTPVRDKSGVAAEAAAAGFPDLAPEPRPTVWLPDSYTWLAWPARTAARRPCRPRPRASGRPTSCSPCPRRSPRRSAGTPSRRSGRTSSTRPPTPTCGATSATPSGAPSSSARRARSSRPPAKRRCSRPSAPPPAILDGPHRGVGRGRRRCRTTVREHELATSHYMATPEHFLWHARQAERQGLGRGLPLGGHRRREVGLGLQPRHHQPRRRDPHRGRAARGEARSDLPHRRVLRRRQPRRRR